MRRIASRRVASRRFPAVGSPRSGPSRRRPRLRRPAGPGAAGPPLPLPGRVWAPAGGEGGASSRLVTAWGAGPSASCQAPASPAAPRGAGDGRCHPRRLLRRDGSSGRASRPVRAVPGVGWGGGRRRAWPEPGWGHVRGCRRLCTLRSARKPGQALGAAGVPLRPKSRRERSPGASDSHVEVELDTTQK